MRAVACDLATEVEILSSRQRRLEIVWADWRLQNGAKRGGRSFCIVNESIAHLLEGLSPSPPPGPRIEIGDWRLEIEIGDLIRPKMTTLEIGD